MPNPTGISVTNTDQLFIYILNEQSRGRSQRKTSTRRQSKELRQWESQDEREKNNKIFRVIYLKVKIWSK
jgi:hypothetical protein